MKTKQLMKIELYRFWLSLPLFIIGCILALGVMFLLKTNPQDLRTSDMVSDSINSAMKIMGMIFCIIISIVIAVYVGREYRLKTILHEVIRGYTQSKIVVSKTISCGVVFAFMLWIIQMIFFLVSSSAREYITFGRSILFFFYLLHICSAALLYVMISRNGIIGGCITFCRFEFVDLLIAILVNLLPEKISYVLKCFLPVLQWGLLINSEANIAPIHYVGVIGSTAIEYVFLLWIVLIRAKKEDY